MRPEESGLAVPCLFQEYTALLAGWLPWLSACRVVFIFLCLCILVCNCIFIFVSLLSGCRRSYLDECGLIQPLCLALPCCSIIRIFQWLHMAWLPLLCCHERIRLSPLLLCLFLCLFFRLIVYLFCYASGWCRVRLPKESTLCRLFPRRPSVGNERLQLRAGAWWASMWDVRWCENSGRWISRVLDVSRSAIWLHSRPSFSQFYV